MRKVIQLAVMLAAPLAAYSHLIPFIVPADPREGEKPVAVSTTNETVEANGLYCRTRVSLVFENPNRRNMSCDVELPLPEGATVCGYRLEVNGVMVPGVVCEKEKARVAFESEKAKRVDPGVVEHVAGNVWRTRVFPLVYGVPRRAEVEYIAPVADGPAQVVCERDGDDVFLGERTSEGELVATIAGAVAGFTKGTILWDASGSAESCAAAWRKRLEALPENGEWSLVVFSHRADVMFGASPCRTKADLLAAIDSLDYDGGTDIGAATALLGSEECPLPALLFTDELDTLGLDTPKYEDIPGLVVASRDDAPARMVSVRKLATGETPPEGVEAKEGKLLATAWAADRIRDLSSQAEVRRGEFLALGRRYGVASPVTSLLVLESLDQYVEHKVEPPAEMHFHDEWVRRMAAKDSEIERREADAEHERDLLGLWKERVEWWNNPIPPRQTPHSGLFDGMRGDRREVAATGRAPSAVNASAPMTEPEEEYEAATEPAVMGASLAMRSVERATEPGETTAAGAAGSGGATISLAAWNPKAPYLDALAGAQDPLREYFAQKRSNGSAPAFFMDCASFFFKRGETEVACRVLSNMAEFGLDNAAIWRTMGWRLREAGCYEAAIRCFCKALRLRGEEGQSRRDLALVLAEHGKATRDARCLSEAMALLRETAFTNWARRSGRRSNDRQVSLVALEELNALISWCAAVEWPDGAAPVVPNIDSAFRRDLPVRIRIVLSWDADETDVDLHVLEPDGEEAYYGHRRTSTGGFVSEDVTTGYGPEEYLRKEGEGRFKILANYFASHQTDLTGAANATATVYTDWGTAAESMKMMTLRLDKPKQNLLIGEIE